MLTEGIVKVIKFMLDTSLLDSEMMNKYVTCPNVDQVVNASSIGSSCLCCRGRQIAKLGWRPSKVACISGYRAILRYHTRVSVFHYSDLCVHNARKWYLRNIAMPFRVIPPSLLYSLSVVYFCQIIIIIWSMYIIHFNLIIIIIYSLYYTLQPDHEHHNNLYVIHFSAIIVIQCICYTLQSDHHHMIYLGDCIEDLVRVAWSQ